MFIPSSLASAANFIKNLLCRSIADAPRLSSRRIHRTSRTSDIPKLWKNDEVSAQRFRLPALFHALFEISALIDTEGLDLQQRDPEAHRFGTLAYLAYFAARST